MLHKVQWQIINQLVCASLNFIYNSHSYPVKRPVHSEQPHIHYLTNNTQEQQLNCLELWS